HPGYGFLSENATFAQLCKENNIIFVGPEPKAMAALGDKVTAKAVARKAGIPLIESNIEILKDEETAIREANRIGYPLMLKSASGGGGRGMRVVRTDQDLRKSFHEARSEAKNAFG